MGAGVPAVVQNLVWAIVATALFVFGGIAIVVTAHKTVEAFRNANDSWSGAVLRNLAVGGFISALLLFGGIYGIIKFAASVNTGFGLASGPSTYERYIGPQPAPLFAAPPAPSAHTSA